MGQTLTRNHYKTRVKSMDEKYIIKKMTVSGYNVPEHLEFCIWDIKEERFIDNAEALCKLLNHFNI